MGNKINDPIVRLMGLRYKSHPWHGLDIGTDAPNVVTAFLPSTARARISLLPVCEPISAMRKTKNGKM